MKKLMNFIPLSILLILLCFPGGLIADSNQKSGEDIDWQVLSSGGDTGTSTNFQLSGTVGQTAVDEGSSTNFDLRHGYWQDFESGGVICVAGDANGSGSVDIDDVVYLIGYIFSGGPPPTPALCCGDANNSGGVDIDDVVYLIGYIFSGGPAPIYAC